MPHVPWTETAPTGSSTCITRSTKATERQTRTPAMSPMITEPTGFTNPEGAVIATRPARNPLPVIEASGFPYTNHMYNIALISPVALANMVLTAIELMRRPPLPDAPRVEPGLKPNQPNAKMRQPVTTSTMSWARMTCGLPSRENFPIRGPRIMAMAKALRPPTACTTPEPAKSQYPLPRPKLTPRLESHPPPQAQLAKRG